MLASIFVAGCDSMVRTSLSVTPAVAGNNRRPDEVLAIVRPVLESHNFGLFSGVNDPTNTVVCFTDWYPGKNPTIWVGVSRNTWPVHIDFDERWTAHRSHKHKSVAKAVEKALVENGFRVIRR